MASIQEKLTNLRKLKEERERLTQQITEMRESANHMAMVQHGPRITNSWDRHQLSMAADSQRVADWVQEDFQTFHQDKIENKLKTARAKVLVSGIISDADAAYEARVRALGVDNLASFQEAEGVIGTRRRSLKRGQQQTNPLSKSHTATKRIVISNPDQSTNLAQQHRDNPGQHKSRSAKLSRSNARIVNHQQLKNKYENEEFNSNPESELEDELDETNSMVSTSDGAATELNSRSASPGVQSSTLSSRAASVLGDDEKRIIISEFIDLAYARIIKICKVYFIRAMYFDYQMPTQQEITEIKDRLLGHLHIPRSKWLGRLPLKSQIEYLNITRDGRVELATAWVMRIKGHHLFVSHNMIGLGKGVKNKWRKLTPHFPVFHKITNNDINIECGFLDNESGTDTNSEFSELAEMTDVETDPETDPENKYMSTGEEYESDD
jgi:hypothetical protein